jgi:hypothetical protein
MEAPKVKPKAPEHLAKVCRYSQYVYFERKEGRFDCIINARL